MNGRIAKALDDARIPVVLLDRTVVPYPERGHHDLVGIDNRRAGYVVTEHLLRLRSAPHRLSWPCRTPPPPWTRAKPATARRCTQPALPFERARVGRLDPADAAAVRA